MCGLTKEDQKLIYSLQFCWRSHAAKEVIEKEDQEERSLQELTAGKGFIAFVAQEYMK